MGNLHVHEYQIMDLLTQVKRMEHMMMKLEDEVRWMQQKVMPRVPAKTQLKVVNEWDLGEPVGYIH